MLDPGSRNGYLYHDEAAYAFSLWPYQGCSQRMRKKNILLFDRLLFIIRKMFKLFIVVVLKL